MLGQAWLVLGLAILIGICLTWLAFLVLIVYRVIKLWSRDDREFDKLDKNYLSTFKPVHTKHLKKID